MPAWSGLQFRFCEGEHECRADDDCGRGEICQSGRCVDGCRDDNGCPNGFECQRNTCVAALECRQDSDCETNFVCENNQCVFNASCERTNDCPDDLVCNNGVCEATERCTVDTDCPEGSICNRGRNRCVIGCRNDSQCPEGTRCEDFKCIFAPECLQDSDCDPNQQCVNNACENIVGCRADSDCGDGRICQNRACVPGCRDAQDCASGQICQNNQCVAEPGCRADSDCSTGQICQNRACVVGCRADGQCPDGFICENNQCEVANECRDAPNPQLIPSDGGTFDSSPTSEVSNYVGSCGGAGPERVFVLEVEESRLFTIRTEGRSQGADTVLYLRDECDVAFTEQNRCNDDADANFNSLLELSLVPGRYFLFVDNFANAGRSTLTVTSNEAQCRSDSDCDGIAICTNGLCLAPQCINDGQCDDSERCLNGRCVQREDFCQFDVDCGDRSQICEDLTCVSANGACADRQDCNGNFCIDGSCTEPFECTSNRACRQIALSCVVSIASADRLRINAVQRRCLDGNSCVFGICLPTETNECADTACDDGLICEERRCLPLNSRLGAVSRLQPFADSRTPGSSI